MPEEHEESKKILAKAKAKIIWGEPLEEAHALLMENGFDSHQAKEHIDNFIKERASYIREMGVIDLSKAILFIRSSLKSLE